MIALVLALRPHEGAELETGGGHESFFHALFEAAGVWAPLTLAVVGIAFAVNLFRLARDFNRRVNGVALGMQLKKLIDAGNPERARKLCNAAPEALAAQLAILGLEARARNEAPYAAMAEMRTRMIDDWRKGTLVAVVFGIGALIESVVMVAAAVSKGFPSGEVGAIAILPAVLACLVAFNVMQFRGMQRDLDAIVEAVR